MRLVTFLHNSKIKAGAQLEDWVIDLRRAQEYLVGKQSTPDGEEIAGLWIPGMMIELIVCGSPLMEHAEHLVASIQASLPHALEALKSEAVLLQPDQFMLMPPVTNPGKLICVGMNYPATSAAQAQKPEYPVLFLKPNSTLTGHGQPIILPRISKQVFCEGELAVVIGRRGKHVDIEKALSYVAGYSVANDVGARDLEQRTSQWATGKLSDTFCPLGPALVTPEQAPDPQALTIQTYINGKLVQSGRTGEMIFSVPELISYISSITTLVPGDIILTGSPKKINDQPAPIVFLNPGDQISIEIDGIGVLSNHTALEEYPDA